ncbi:MULTISPECIES: Pup--protein ligase [Corynebacterium]|uniref:Pup--protein ligase n=1 Tax=Corynebacterium TaxID=1716 RepID=UPI00124C71B0|nr:MULTISPECIES: Pup--protein ligase [Corynebacterium]
MTHGDSTPETQHAAAESVEAAILRRIMGIETEYGVSFRCAPGQRCREITPDEVARHLYRPIRERFSSTNIFTRNAGRLYLDVGDHPEYASAECDSIEQLINYHIAGDRLVNQLAEQAQTSLETMGYPGSIYLFKNNVDSRGNSYGAHENYLVSRDTSLKVLSRTLLPFLITRQLICGAGMIHHPRLPQADDFSLGYCLSQRADHVWEGVSSATTRTRPIINTRDEPHADSKRYRRLHVIVGDANMAEPTIALKLGSTLLVLELIEAGMPLPDVELESSVGAIREISRDLSGAAAVPLRNGSTLPALEIQRIYLHAAQQWLQQRPEPNAELERVVELWEKVITCFDTGDFTPVSRDIDWVIKRSLLQRYQTRLGCGLDHPRLAQVDLTYHDIAPDRGLALLLQRKGLINRWTSDEAIDAAMFHAPTTTRAHLRGRFLDAAYTRAAPVAVDWMRMKVSRPEPQLVELGDPFATTDPDVDALIAYMEKHFPLCEGAHCCRQRDNLRL